MFGCPDGCLPRVATTNLRHYCCFGRIHVKTGLLAIICIVAAVEILEIVVFITGKYSVPSAWQIFFEILEAVCFLSLISAYKTKRSLFLWPFMVSQFLVVMAASLVAIICLVTFFFPRSAYREIFAKGLSLENDESNGAIRLRAIISFHFYFFAAIVESWALTITLACHRYFDEVNEAREQRMRRNRNYDGRNHVAHEIHENLMEISRRGLMKYGQGVGYRGDSELPQKKSRCVSNPMDPDRAITQQPEASTSGSQISGFDHIAPDSFDNPNYAFPDSDGEDVPKPFQERDGKTAIV